MQEIFHQPKIFLLIISISLKKAAGMKILPFLNLKGLIDAAGLVSQFLFFEIYIC